MSLENVVQRLPDQLAETDHEAPKKAKISYTTEFLLSLSELESCKKLPDGLDQSFLSEFEEAFSGQRPSSGLSANSFRRNDYSSSPPTRGDAAGYSRPLHGRWEIRSSVRSDKDSDTQSDKDSDSGRHYGNQSRRPWQVPEHDGLLGSGSFPRAAGFAGGIAASKVQPNDNSYQFKRTNEPYQPPRPYKTGPLARKEIADSLNDETFGSDNTTEDRAEEERKRRDSFEQMRKEQQKAFQDMQKLKPEKVKGGFDFSSLLNDDSEEKRPLPTSSETTEPRIPPAFNNDREKSTLPSQTPASRPLVPPGFASTVVDRKIGTKSLNLPHQVEVENSGLEDNILHGKGNRIVNGSSDSRVEKQPVEQMILDEQNHATASNASLDRMSEKSLNFLPPHGANNKIIDMDGQIYNKFNTRQVVEASRNSDATEINTEKVFESTSILGKLFSGAVPLNDLGSSNIIEPHTSIIDEAVDSHTVNSSKFVQWFHEEDKKPANEILSGRPNDLLSMIVGSERPEAHIADVRLSNHGFPSFPIQNAKPAERILTSNILPPVASDSEHLYRSTKPEAASAVLTCEDLEQFILSGISGNVPALLPPVQRSIVPDRHGGHPKASVDNHATQHLLSLLQKGTGVRDIEPSLDQEAASHEKIQNINGTATLHITKEKGPENVSDSGKSPTLETLFGTAFMKELQSVAAPVSTKRDLVGPARVESMGTQGSSFPQSEISYAPAFDVGTNSSTHTNSDMTGNERKQTKSDKLDEQLLGFDNPLDSLQVRSHLGSKMGVRDGPADVRLPGEGSLLAGSEPLNIQNFMSTRNLMESKVVCSPNTEVNVAEKLVAFDSGFKDFNDARSLESQGSGPPFLRGPYDMSQSEISYQNLNLQPSSQHLHHPQMNHMGTLFHPSDSHPGNANSGMNFATPEGMIRADPPQSHQFPVNMLRPPFHHLNSAQSGFDAHHHPMLQQMHMAGSFPPPHLQQGLSGAPVLPPHMNRGTPIMPAHPKSQVSGFMEELSPMAGYPFGPRPVNLGGHGMPSPAPDVAVGSNHPEALRKLLDMEMRSNPKQIHPFASGRGMYVHELDMGLGFR